VRLHLALLALIPFAAACGPVPPPAEPTRDSAATTTSPPALVAGRVALTRLRAEPYSFAYSSGFDEAAQLVIRDTAAWAQAWARIYARHGEAPPRPAFDPATERLVLVAIGTRATGGFSILLDSALVARDTLVVHATSSRPGQRCGTTAALTQPVDVARVPRLEAPVRFAVRETVTECR
jgi:hypothetical protein